MYGVNQLLSLVVLLALVSLAIGSSFAFAEAEQTDAAVAAVVSGTLLQLEDDRLVRLAGIRLPGNGADPESVAVGERAKQTLGEMIGQSPVRLQIAEQGTDRHGRLLAHVWRDDLWLQGALLKRGLAQVQTRKGETALADEMMARERIARRSGAGLWASDRFAPRPADQVDQLDQEAGSFQIVQGRVRRAAPTKRYLYLNFGADWRSDFTVRIARRAVRDFERVGIDLEELAGRRVEVRGYVLEAGGPLIELSHPEQIRIQPGSGALGHPSSASAAP